MPPAVGPCLLCLWELPKLSQPTVAREAAVGFWAEQGHSPYFCPYHPSAPLRPDLQPARELVSTTAANAAGDSESLS